MRDRAGLFLLTPQEQDRRALAEAAFRIDEVSKAYGDFIAQFSPLAAALEHSSPKDDEALVARTLLIHSFRRVVLRDPGLPRELLPQDWKGEAARALAASVYGRVVPRFRAIPGRSGPERGR